MDTYNGSVTVEGSEDNVAIKGDTSLLFQNLHPEILFSVFVYFLLYFHKNVCPVRAGTLSFLFSITQPVSRIVSINRSVGAQYTVE